MNRPLASVVIAYAAGLLCAQLWQPPVVWLLTSAFATLISALLVKKIRPPLLCLLLALAGWANILVHTTVVSPINLRIVLGNEPAIVSVRGRLDETPRQKISIRDEQEKWRSVARVRVNEIVRDEKTVPAAGEILAIVPGIPAPTLFAGQNVEITGVISRPPPALAEGLFDFQSYLATRGIYYQLATKNTNDWKILPPTSSRPPLTDRFLNWSKQTLALGLPGEDEPLRLLWAMTLGWRTAFTGDIGEPFLRAGTINYFLNL